MNSGVVTFESQVLFKLVTDVIVNDEKTNMNDIKDFFSNIKNIVKPKDLVGKIEKISKVRLNKSLLNYYQAKNLGMDVEIDENVQTFIDNSIFNSPNKILDSEKLTDREFYQRLLQMNFRKVFQNTKPKAYMTELDIIIKYAKEHKIKKVLTDIDARYCLITNYKKMVPEEIKYDLIMESVKFLSENSKRFANSNNIPEQKLQSYIDNLHYRLRDDKSLQRLQQVYYSLSKLMTLNNVRKIKDHITLLTSSPKVHRKRIALLLKKWNYKKLSDVKLPEIDSSLIEGFPKNYKSIVLPNFKVIHNLATGELFILDNQNFDLVLRSMLRYTMFKLYKNTQRLNSKINSETIQATDFINLSEYTELQIQNVYGIFKINNKNLSYLPRFFHDFNELILAELANEDGDIFKRTEKIISGMKKKDIYFKDIIFDMMKEFKKYPPQIQLDCGKIYRFLTTPDYDMSGALNDLMETFSSEQKYNPEVFEEFDALQLRELSKGYYKKYKTMPNLDFTEAMNHYLELRPTNEDDEEGRDIEVTETYEGLLKANLDIWKTVNPSKIFPYVNYSDYWCLESEDKRNISYNFKNYTDIVKISDEPIYNHNELLFSLRDLDLDRVKNFKSKIENREKIDPIPIVLAYKDEIHKPKSRLFFMAPPEVRYLMSELEQNLELILNLKPGNSMTAGVQHIEDKLMKLADATLPNLNYFTMIISFDLEKFSTKFPRAILYREMKKLSLLFGEKWIANIDMIFENCHLVHSTKNQIFTVPSKNGCYEGFLNKFWTLYHIDVMVYTMYKVRKEFNLKKETIIYLAAFSDDGALTIQCKQRNKLYKEDKLRIYDRICEIYMKCGLKISDEKTYVSETFCVFLNKYYYNGTMINTPLKSFMRITHKNQNKFDTIFDQLDSIYSTTQGFLTSGGAVLHGYFSYLILSYMRIKLLIGDHFKFKSEEMFLFMVTPRELGGIGISTYYQLCSSLETDVLSKGIFSLLVTKKYENNLSMMVDNIINQSLKIFMPGISSNNLKTISCVDQYTSLMYLNNLSKHTILSYTKNPMFLKIFNNLKDTTHVDFCTTLWDYKNLDARLYEELTSLTPYSIANTIIQGLNKSQTIIKMLRYKKAIKIKSKIRKLDFLYVKKFFTDILYPKIIKDPYLLKFYTPNEYLQLTMKIREVYYGRTDITNHSEPCCSTIAKMDYENTIKLLSIAKNNKEQFEIERSKLLLYEYSTMKSPIFAYIRRSTKLSATQYINETNMYNLHNYSKRTSTYSYNNFPKGVKYGKLDNVMRRLLILYSYEKSENIGFLKALLELSSMWNIDLERSLLAIPGEKAGSFQAHMMTLKPNHTVLGHRNSMEQVIICAPGVRKYDENQRFDIYRYILCLHLVMATELEILDDKLSEVISICPIVFFSLPAVVFDPDNRINFQNSDVKVKPINHLIASDAPLRVYESGIDILTYNINYMNTLWESIIKEGMLMLQEEKEVLEISEEYQQYMDTYKFSKQLWSLYGSITSFGILNSIYKRSIAEKPSGILTEESRFVSKIDTDTLYTINKEAHIGMLINILIFKLLSKENLFVVGSKEQHYHMKLTVLGKYIGAILVPQQDLYDTNEGAPLHSKFKNIIKVYKLDKLFLKALNTLEIKNMAFKRKLVHTIKSHLDQQGNDYMSSPSMYYLFNRTIQNMWNTRFGSSSSEKIWKFIINSSCSDKYNIETLIRQTNFFTSKMAKLYKIFYTYKEKGYGKKIIMNENVELNKSLKINMQLKRSFLSSKRYLINEEKMVEPDYMLFYKVFKHKSYKLYSRYKKDTDVDIKIKENVDYSISVINADDLFSSNIKLLYKEFVSFMRDDCNYINSRIEDEAKLYSINETENIDLYFKMVVENKPIVDVWKTDYKITPSEKIEIIAVPEIIKRPIVEELSFKIHIAEPKPVEEPKMITKKKKWQSYLIEPELHFMTNLPDPNFDLFCNMGVTKMQSNNRYKQYALFYNAIGYTLKIIEKNKDFSHAEGSEYSFIKYYTQLLEYANLDKKVFFLRSSSTSLMYLNVVYSIMIRRDRDVILVNDLFFKNNLELQIIYKDYIKKDYIIKDKYIGVKLIDKENLIFKLTDESPIMYYYDDIELLITDICNLFKSDDDLELFCENTSLYDISTIEHFISNLSYINFDNLSTMHNEETKIKRLAQRNKDMLKLLEVFTKKRTKRVLEISEININKREEKWIVDKKLTNTKEENLIDVYKTIPMNLDCKDLVSSGVLLPYILQTDYIEDMSNPYNDALSNSYYSKFHDLASDNFLSICPLGSAYMGMLYLFIPPIPGTVKIKEIEKLAKNALPDEASGITSSIINTDELSEEILK